MDTIETKRNTGTRAMSGARKEKPKNDFYPTPAATTHALFRSEGKFKPFSGRVWEPAAGKGDMLNVIREYCPDAIGTDLIDYGAGLKTGVDFLLEQNGGHDSIITNPPYSLAEEFIHKALELTAPDGRVCMLLRMAFLEGQRRRKSLFEKTPLARIWVFSGRQALWRDGIVGENGGTIFYGWFVWDKTCPVGGPIQTWFADEVKP